MPLYLSQLRLAVINGFKGQSKEKWNAFRRKLDRVASSIEFDNEFGNLGKSFVFCYNNFEAFVKLSNYIQLLLLVSLLHSSRFKYNYFSKNVKNCITMKIVFY
jgi:hypothetical protein